MKISNNKIYITGLNEYEDSGIDKTITKLNENFQKIFSITEFIKKYDVTCLYPIMLLNPGNLKIKAFEQQNTLKDLCIMLHKCRHYRK